MALREERTFTAYEFQEWNLKQARRYELIDGHAVEMMTGARRPHRLCVSNVFGELLEPVRRKGCEPTTHNAAVQVADDRVRYPDLVVECGEPDDEGTLDAVNPRLILEVLSDSTHYTDLRTKLVEYRSLPTVETVIFVDPAVVFVDVHSRKSDGWTSALLTDLSDEIDLPAFDMTLPLVRIYRGLEPRPHLRTVD